MMNWMIPRRVLLVAILIGMAGGESVFAQTGGKPADKKPDNTSVNSDQNETPEARLAKAWQVFFDGKFPDAIQLADSLSKIQQEQIKLEARHLMARCLWSMGQAALAGDPKNAAQNKQTADKAFSDARSIWKELSTSTGNASIKRKSIATALELALKDKQDEAAVELDKVLTAEYADTCTIEAGLLYAELRAAQGSYKEAIRGCQFAVDFARKLPLGNEIKLSSVKPFIDAGDKLLKRLKTEPAAAGFAAAEKLRANKEFIRAQIAYENVSRDFPETDFSPRSDFSVGLCFLGMKDVQKALDYWRKLIDAAPSGPWRGQTYIAMVNANLGDKFDPAAAMSVAEEAAKSLDGGLADPKAGTSWKPVRFDVLFLSGMLAYSQDQHDLALDRLETAQKAADALDDSGKDGLARLIEGAKNKSLVIPPSVRNPKELRIHELLAIGYVYNIIHKCPEAEQYFNLVLDELAKSISGRSTALVNEQKACAYRGKAISLHFRHSWEQAIQNYDLSLKTFNSAVWHDYTLHMAGLAVMQQAQEKYYKAVKTATHRSFDQNLEVQTKDAKDKSDAMQAYKKERLASLPYYMKLITGFPKSEYTNIARFNAGIFTYEGDNRDNGAKLLDDFIKACPEHFCTGEALLILSRHVLDYKLDAQATGKYLDLLDKWVSWARGKAKEGVQPDHNAPPNPFAAKSSYTMNSDGKTGSFKMEGESNYRDYIDFLGLESCYTCDWYMNDLETHCALFRGFLYFVDGQFDKAKEQFDRSKTIDPERVARLSGWRGGFYASLDAAIETHALYAKPEEMKYYQGKQRFAIMLADFYFGMWQQPRAQELIQRVLDGEFGSCKGPARDYPLFLHAVCILDTEGKYRAIEEFVNVFKNVDNLKSKNVSITYDRAAWAAANLSWICRGEKYGKLFEEVCQAMVSSNRINESTLDARIGLIRLIFENGNHEEAFKMLEDFPDDIPYMKKLSRAMFSILKKKEIYLLGQEQERTRKNNHKGDDNVR